MTLPTPAPSMSHDYDTPEGCFTASKLLLTALEAKLASLPPLDPEDPTDHIIRGCHFQLDAINPPSMAHIEEATALATLTILAFQPASATNIACRIFSLIVSGRMLTMPEATPEAIAEANAHFSEDPYPILLNFINNLA